MVIGSVGIPARYGGFETFAQNLSIKIAKNNDVTVICSKKDYKRSERNPTWNSIHRVFLPLSANGIQGIVYDLISLIKSKGKADQIILLGCGIGLFLPLFSKFVRKKIWLHIDGLEWKRRKWNYFVKKYLYISCSIGIHYSEKIIMDNEALREYIPKKYYYKMVKTGYGGDHLPKLIKATQSLKDSYALVIARAEPENNLGLILNAFGKENGIHLVVVANWNQTRLGKQLQHKYANNASISLIGPIYNDLVKLHTFRIHCSVYIHGHAAGGTNPSLVEAMYAGVPVFAFDNKFNRKTTGNLAFYFKTDKELMDLLNNRNQLDLQGSAQKLNNYALKFHTWERALEAFNF